ncbi:MAG: Biopolymer transport protein ExbD [Verrucomicrobia subdivision 3 bacterium]|nr:Biopolymer transport protein ExbD [Limisphaerales bacterium]MCS1413839.1 Biopolymer transport protein ExbD [Limisphaerales bacterium]
MRRFSDRNVLVTLSDINITPLLDLAFVLLIIFMITTPLLDQGMDLELPKGGSPDVALDPDQIRVVEVSAEGKYHLDQIEIDLTDLFAALGSAFQADPGIAVYLRADKSVTWESVAAVVDLLTKLGIPNVSMLTEFSAE